MKKALKITGLVILFLLAALIALPFVFKGKIEEEVKKAINENVNAEVSWTDYGLSVFKNFPNATISLDSLDVMGKEDFEGVPLAKIPRLDVSIDLMSLFGDSAKVNSFKLVDPLINIQVLENGKANYDIAMPSEEEEEVVTTETGSFSMGIQEYEIENGTFSYVDETSDMVIYLENFDHKGEGDFTNDLVTLVTKTQAEELDFVFDNVAYINQVEADIDLELLMDLGKMRFDIQGNEIKLNDLKLLAEGFVEMPEDRIVMDIKYKAPSTDIRQLMSMVPSEFTGDISGIDAAGSLKLDGFITGTVVGNQLPAIGLDIKIADGFIQYPDLPEAIKGLVLDASLHIPEGNNMDKLEVNIPQLKMNIAGNPIDARFLFTQPFTNQFIDAKILANLDFEKLSKAFPLDDTQLNGLLDADVVLKGNISELTKNDFSKFVANGLVNVQNMKVDASDTYQMDISAAKFEVTPSSIKMPEFTGQIGETDLQANGEIKNFLAYAFNGEMLKGEFNLQSNFINMEDFMTTDDEESEAAAEEELDYYIDVPENLQFELNADLNKVKFYDVEMQSVKGNVGIIDGVAAMNDVKLEVLGGSVQVDGTYTTKNSDKPKIDFDYRLANLDIAAMSEKFEIISELAPIAKYCEGKFGSTMSFSSELGKDMFPLLESISASGDVKTNTVEVDKFKPLSAIAEKLKISSLAKQRIDDIKLSFTAQDGKITVDPYELELDGMKTVIGGSMTLNQEIDYTVKIDVPFEKLPSQGTEFANTLLDKVNELGTNFSTGQTVPVTLGLTGNIDSPKISLSGVAAGAGTTIKEEVKEQITELVEDKVTEVKEDATEQVNAEAEKLMADARAQAEDVRKKGIKLADDGKVEAYKLAQDIEDNAKKPWEKIAAKVAADKARKKADEAHVKAVKKANDQADKIIQDAEDKKNSLLGK